MFYIADSIADPTTVLLCPFGLPEILAAAHMGIVLKWFSSEGNIYKGSHIYVLKFWAQNCSTN